jgi:hypothetical protein
MCLIRQALEATSPDNRRPTRAARPKSVSQIQLYALARCREAIDVASRIMREPKDGDNMRLLAAELILDRGVGRPGQAVSLEGLIGLFSR